ncbi:MAG: TatD family hydrolase [Phycisphaerae bacterium]
MDAAQPASPLCDAHLHLQDEAYARDRAAVIRAATDAGVRRFVVNATCQADWQEVLDLAAIHQGMTACLGLHPWFVGRATIDWPRQLEDLLRENPSAGIGEIGLDQWIEPRDEKAQARAFVIQLDLADRFGRPVMIHCLRAWGWLMKILRSRPAPPPAGMLIHACGASEELIDELAEMGAYFSVAGDTFESKRKRKQRAAAHIPAERLLIETDAPDMLPAEHLDPVSWTDPAGRQRNVPANLPAICRALAELRQTSPPQLAETCWANARRFLGPLLEAEE